MNLNPYPLDRAPSCLQLPLQRFLPPRHHGTYPLDRAPSCLQLPLQRFLPPRHHGTYPLDRAPSCLQLFLQRFLPHATTPPRHILRPYRAIKRSWVKKGAAVIDVGTNSVPDATKKSGYRLTGDVDFDEVVKVRSNLKPKP